MPTNSLRWWYFEAYFSSPVRFYFPDDADVATAVEVVNGALERSLPGFIAGVDEYDIEIIPQEHVCLLHKFCGHLEDDDVLATVFQEELEATWRSAENAIRTAFERHAANRAEDVAVTGIYVEFDGAPFGGDLCEFEIDHSPANTEEVMEGIAEDLEAVRYDYFIEEDWGYEEEEAEQDEESEQPKDEPRAYMQVMIRLPTS